jgi:hypothetical protein
MRILGIPLLLLSLVLGGYSAFIFFMPEKSIGQETYQKFQSNESYRKKLGKCSSIALTSEEELTKIRRAEFISTIVLEKAKAYKFFVAATVLLLLASLAIKYKNKLATIYVLRVWPWYQTTLTWLVIGLLIMVLPSLILFWAVLWDAEGKSFITFHAVFMYWVWHFITPFGWINLYMLALAICRKDPGHLRYSYLICFFLGLLMPLVFGMCEVAMGV